MKLGDWLSTATDRLHQRLGRSEAYPAHQQPIAGYDRSTAALEARLIAARCLNLSNSAVLAAPERGLTSEHTTLLNRWLTRRLELYPVAYLLGEADFHALTFQVNPYVLVPRAETELLVDLVLDSRPDQSGVRCIDLGTGCGCVAISIAHQRPSWSVEATDNNRQALKLAQANAAQSGVAGIVWTVSNWLEGLGVYDTIVVNPPYIGLDLPVLNTLCHEPLGALYAGEDGLQAIDTLLATAGDHLRSQGSLLIEIGADQSESARALAERHRWRSIEIVADAAQRPRVLRVSR